MILGFAALMYIPLEQIKAIGFKSNYSSNNECYNS